MAETMVISCPECKTKIRVPESAAGKKVRCKKCETLIPVPIEEELDEEIEEVEEAAPKKPVRKPAPKASAAKKPEPKKPEPKKPEPKKPEPPKPTAAPGEEEDDDKPFVLREEDERQRCPQCASAMDDDAVVCIECGFNTRTRSMAKLRKVKDVTGGDQFLWLLPGIVCAFFAVTFIVYWILHHFVFPGAFLDNWDVVLETKKKRSDALNDDNMPGWAFIFQPWFETICIVIFGFVSFFLGRFAVKRLIFNPNPPEVEYN